MLCAKDEAYEQEALSGNFGAFPVEKGISRFRGRPMRHFGASCLPHGEGSRHLGQIPLKGGEAP